MLARMESDGAIAAERDLEFRHDPARLRKTISSLVKADSVLWFKHLLQLLYDIEVAEPTSLVRLPNEHLRLHIVPSQPIISEALTARRVYQKEGSLFALRTDAQMARILCEVEGTLTYRHACQPEEVLEVSRGQFRLASRLDSGPERGIHLDFPLQALLPLRIFSYTPSSIGQSLQPFTSLHPRPPVMDRMKPLIPDWPFIPPILEGEEDVPTLWDWEAVMPSTESGFSWAVSAWGEALTTLDAPRDLPIISHPLEMRRGNSTLPIMGCYPAQIARQVGLGPPPTRALIKVNSQRVLGISCAAGALKRAELFPVIRGVPGSPIVLNGVPPGLYLLANASHLRTDACRLSLVRDQATEDWLKELVGWAKTQTELYIPFMAQIPRLWMSRIKSWEQLDRPVSAWKTFWQTAVAGLFSVVPDQGLVDRRAETLDAWSRRRD